MKSTFMKANLHWSCVTLRTVGRAVLLLATALFFGETARAAETTWQASGISAWNNGVNWNNGEPVVSSTAVLNNGGIATLSSEQVGAYRELRVGDNTGGGGAITISGGSLSGINTSLGYAAGTSGSATVTSGTWRNTLNFYVGNSGTGNFLVSGGHFSGGVLVYIGYNAGSDGRIAVTGGTLSATNFLIGRSGTGALVISGGLVQVSATTIISQPGGSGKIILSGNEEMRGVLESNAISKGGGSGSIHFDGGILRAKGANPNLIGGFAAGEVTIGAGGAYIDVSQGNVSITSSLSGSGALIKQGISSLTLSASNSYSGGTRVEGGTLVAAHNLAFGIGGVTLTGGTLSIKSGIVISNTVTLNGATLVTEVEKDSSLAGVVKASTTLGNQSPTRAAILGGTSSGVTSLQASFAASSTASNDETRVSGVLSLSGVALTSDTNSATDTFVLQLQVNSVTTDSFLAWFNPDSKSWVNAVEGNFGGTAHFVGNKAFNPTTDLLLGNYGVDTSNGSVWAVINHNSDFAVVPEPGAFALLVCGAGVTLVWRRRHKVQTAIIA